MIYLKCLKERTSKQEYSSWHVYHSKLKDRVSFFIGEGLGVKVGGGRREKWLHPNPEIPPHRQQSPSFSQRQLCFQLSSGQGSCCQQCLGSISYYRQKSHQDEGREKENLYSTFFQEEECMTPF